MPSAMAARERMTRIAVEQTDKVSADWDPGQRDCAGFIRFVYRTAFNWHGPLFQDRDGKMQAFLSARDLVSGDFVRIGRDPKSELVRTGDVLAYFRSANAPPDDWHLMMVLDPPRGVPSRRLIAYHNGASGQAGGVKTAWLDDLWNAAEVTWQPRPSNPAFVGVFRWKGWRDFYEDDTLTHHRIGRVGVRDARRGR